MLIWLSTAILHTIIYHKAKQWLSLSWKGAPAVNSVARGFQLHRLRKRVKALIFHLKKKMTQGFYDNCFSNNSCQIQRGRGLCGHRFRDQRVAGVHSRILVRARTPMGTVRSRIFQNSAYKIGGFITIKQTELISSALNALEQTSNRVKKAIGGWWIEKAATFLLPW